MKRKLLPLLVLLVLLIELSSCVMRYPKGTSFRQNTSYVRTHRHFGAKKNFKQRKQLWGRKHYGPRPYNHRGWFRF